MGVATHVIPADTGDGARTRQRIGRAGNGTVVGRMSTALHDLRRARRIRRLGELEWFEIAYRVYLTALGGGVAVLWLTDLVDDAPATDAEVTDVLGRGPGILGLAAAFALATGLRSGSNGGPISVEAGDVRHLLLAPVPRRRVLARPVAQRLRALGSAGAAVGAVGGLLAARRLPGSPAAWMASASAAGFVAVALFVAAAVLAHAFRLPRPIATLGAGVVLAWQAAAAAGAIAGPFDGLGGLALWGMRQRLVELVPVIAVAAGVAAAIAVAGRLRVEPLVRRAELVSQLHFAVAVQDLRTVVLLRRQLRGEHARQRPWFAVRRSGCSLAGAVRQRGFMGIARSPLARVGRMAALSVAAGLGALAVLSGTTPAVAAVGAALFLLGLDAFEPLAQEVDHPERTDGLPRDRGWILARHLVAPALALAPFAALAAAVVAVGRPSVAGGAFALAVPMTVAGAAGAVVSIVRGAPDPVGAFNTAIPPEFGGFKESLRVLLPVAISTLAALPLLVLRDHTTANVALRAAVGLVLAVGLVAWWVRRRDQYRDRVRAFLEAGRAAR
jgi:hypothetical protein